MGAANQSIPFLPPLAVGILHVLGRHSGWSSSIPWGEGRQKLRSGDFLAVSGVRILVILNFASVTCLRTLVSGDFLAVRRNSRFACLNSTNVCRNSKDVSRNSTLVSGDFSDVSVDFLAVSGGFLNVHFRNDGDDDSTAASDFGFRSLCLGVRLVISTEHCELITLFMAEAQRCRLIFTATGAKPAPLIPSPGGVWQRWPGCVRARCCDPRWVGDSRERWSGCLWAEPGSARGIRL